MFEIRQCTRPDCRLRLPIDPAVQRGAYCPRCGAPMGLMKTFFQHKEHSTNEVPKRELSVLLDNLRSVYNTGAIFRTADGVGVTHLYLGGITPNPADNSAIQKTALGAEEIIPWSVHLDAVSLAVEMRAEGYQLVALETTPGSISLFKANLDLLGESPILLIVGNELAGIDPGLIDLCDLVLEVPMVGSKASLNVAVAFGVAAYWLAFS